jgi:predicted phosphodiesterase
MKIIVIGDVHCKIKKYHEIISSCEKSIQVGDFGFREEWDWLEENVSAEHKINMGNHDYIPYLNKPHSLGNWSYENGIFTVRGANSVDIHKRTEGIDWFPNEEINYQETNEVFDNYIEIKPEIMITHDCPSSVAEILFGFPTSGINKEVFKSHTRELLQGLFEIHQPRIHIFGHHHKSRDMVINGTRFICLAELETFEL